MHLAAKQIEVIGQEADCVITLTGDIDMASAPTIAKTAAAAIAVSPASGVTLDLAAVTFIDASGLSALLTIRQAAACNNKTLHLTGLTPRTVQVITIAGLAEPLDLHEKTDP
jgi:anti-anti-sigma factor